MGRFSSRWEDSRNYKPATAGDMSEGFGCPFSQIVAEHPKLCLVAQVLVSELLGREVHEQRGERP